MFERMPAGRAIQTDELHDVVSIEWAGNERLVYTQPDVHGRPAKVSPSGT